MNLSNFIVEDKSSLDRFFDDKTILKGKNLLNNVRKTIVKEEKNYLCIQGGTKSARTDEVYYQNIVIPRKYQTSFKPDDLLEGDKFKAVCSCPVGYNCKHSYALILKFIRESQGTSSREINHWLNTIKNISQIFDDYEDDDYQKNNNYFFSYQLEKHSKENALVIKPIKRKILKRGGLGKSSSFTFNTYETLPDYISETDASILMELTGALNSGYYRTNKEFLIKSEPMFLAFKRLLKTKKLHLENGETLFLGEDRRGFLSWKHENNVLSLELKFENEDIELIPELPEIFYINWNTGEVGKVTGINFKASVLNVLLKEAIYLTEGQLKELEKKINNIKHLPPLTDKQEKFSKPIPYLHLKQDNVTLKFDYDGVKIDTHSKKEFIEKKDAIIHRDFNLEQKFIEELSQFGLVPNSKIKLETADEVEKIRNFFEFGISDLEENGWKIKIDEEEKISFKEVDSEDIDFEVNDDNRSNLEWFSMEFLIDVDGQKLKLAPIIESYFSKIQVYDESFTPDKINIPIGNKSFIRLDRDKVKPIINTVLKFYNKEKQEIEVLGHDLHNLELTEGLEARLKEKNYDIFKLKEKLKEFRQIELIHQPKGLNAELREYQKEGISWLNFLKEYNFGGVLADDMGLGKTIQTLGFLLHEKNKNKEFKKPNLIVVPTSLLGNWKRENEKFSPDLSLRILHQADRKNVYKNIINGTEKFDILVTTYNLITRDLKELVQIDFSSIILDEAQKIKNPKAKISKNLRLLKSENRICLTGTPMENHLGELWSLFDFLMPKFLLSENEFTRFFKTPIEKNNNLKTLQNLKNRIKPFILRREKREVARELPPKTEIVQRVTFSNKQAKLYESIRVTMEKKVQKAIRENGLGKSQIQILDALLKLRQVCCDPRLLKVGEEEKIDESAKLEGLIELLDELMSENRKVIIFSQFTSMLSLIENELNKKKIIYSKLTGSTRDRDQEINMFKSGKVDIFLVSLKAGGVGLNLTEADTIIIYDPWWNPAVENQAIDRAYRIGQDKKVFVHRFIVENSVEEKILELQDKKKNLSDSILEDGTENFQITQDDIAELFAPLK